MPPSLSGTSTRVSFRTAVESVDPRVDSFAYSPVKFCCDIAYTGQLCTFAPTMARTFDWVDEQSSSNESSAPRSTTHSDQPVTPPPRVKRDESDHPKGRPDKTLSKKRSRFVYDIPTLLQLRQTQGQIPVMLHVKPEAIAGMYLSTFRIETSTDDVPSENIFQYISAAGTRQSPVRSRGLSDISNASRGSISSATNYHPPANSKYLAVPRAFRQAPTLNTESSMSQRADGFVRFLAQHASPPHNRVTAGGRIVPAGPTSPPPMLDFASLNDLVRNKLANAEISQKEGRSVLSALRPYQTANSAAPSMMYGDCTPDQDTNFGGQSQLPATFVQAPGFENPCGYPTLTPLLPTSTAVIPMSILPDGSTLVSYNGNNYRTYWNGINTVMEPLQSLQPPIEHQSFVSNYQPEVYNLAQPQQVNLQNTSIPLTISAKDTRPPNRKENSSFQSQGSRDDESKLKDQLTRLDKHMALYHFEISSVEHSEFVAQRRLLVEAIDKIRTAKEPSRRSIPIIEPTTGQPITPISKLNLNRKATGSNRNISNNDPANGKGLSPAALPFVPRKIRNSSSETSQMRIFSDQSQMRDLDVEKRRTSNRPAQLNLKDMADLAMARKDKALISAALTGSTLVDSRREDSTSSILDPSDPAMRIIEYDDIEYAERYLYNWNLEKKTYCTTVAEFQDAIRRVREQARTYGCFGGQSKDPAYDAEQDLWWAICERDPIPLPTELPDHIENPRPWNWDDSAFNFRRDGTTAPLSEPAWVNARSSPRLMGWDVATTEKAKDSVDVTRSFYALKGHLPSVPFRTWAYDRHGNKVGVSSRGHDNSIDNHGPRTQAVDVSTPKNTASNLRPLQDLSLNIVQNRPTGSRLTAAAQPIRKKNLTEGDAMPHSKLDALQHVSHQRKVDSLRNAKSQAPVTSAQTNLKARTPQVSIEDCSESPQKAGATVEIQGEIFSTTPKRARRTVSNINNESTSAMQSAASLANSNHTNYLDGAYTSPGDISSVHVQVPSKDTVDILSSQSAEMPNNLFSSPRSVSSRNRPFSGANPKVKIPPPLSSPSESIYNGLEASTDLLPRYTLIETSSGKPH